MRRGWIESCPPGKEPGSYGEDEETAIPVAQVEALLRLLFPDHMTPIAKRQFDQVIEQHRKGST